MKLEIKMPEVLEVNEYYLSKHDRVQIAQTCDDFIDNLHTIRYQKRSLDRWETISFEKIRNVKDAREFINQVKVTYIN